MGLHVSIRDEEIILCQDDQALWSLSHFHLHQLQMERDPSLGNVGSWSSFCLSGILEQMHSKNK